ncbi:MAG: hypothetical protein ABIH34_04890 [Nanoarchaeota archaeon]
MKKGDLSLQTIAVAVLTLIVIVVVAFIFKEQITHWVSQIFKLGHSINVDPNCYLDPEACKEAAGAAGG